MAKCRLCKKDSFEEPRQTALQSLLFDYYAWFFKANPAPGAPVRRPFVDPMNGSEIYYLAPDEIFFFCLRSLNRDIPVYAGSFQVDSRHDIINLKEMPPLLVSDRG